MVCPAPCGKVWYVSNNHGRTRKCDFSVFGRKIPFWANLVKKKKKIKIVYLSWDLVPKLIRICKIQWRSLFIFSVLDRKHFLGKFGPKNQTVQFKLKFRTFLKVAVTDTRYFARSKLCRSLVHKKNFSLIWQVVFKLGYLFCQ